METPTTKWQPIATAPLDTPILVTDGNVVVVGMFERLGKGVDSLWFAPVGFGGYEWEWNFEDDQLTHWMPLPPLPDKQGEQCAK